MDVELIRYTEDAEELCGMAAAICTESSNYGKSLQHSLASGHTSVLEHAVFTFRVSGLSRAALAQLTRHRLAAYSVQSQRYVTIEEWEPVVPDSVMDAGFGPEFTEMVDKTIELYKRMVDAGVPKGDARYVTPQAVQTALIFTMNARELLHFFSLRACNRAQWEIRALADEMLRMCKAVCPVIFANAGPGCVAGGCPEARPCGSPRGKEEWDF